ncbi:MAG: DUF1573 domain-containing protein [Bacteroidetes bacterium]|nr:DUF1573 domain-containing protein [Bacteroidota bacterium]MBV6459963.1 hypothetical protein [Flavobacteriales bacterium]WKZ76393.1 MAG: DUF1573 domain-containing protein [Vicingaceae bacterium]MCL4816313.1 DUF1573 domain-containing protein [Flavobacteriales bacterium]NOG95359.1 DUF1573 domain-containing protein [Bacteroidota bacterium]
MKKIALISFITVLFFASCENKESEISSDLINNPNTASEVDPEHMPVITFDNEVYDFGEIVQGEKVNHSFTFKNTGNADLLISSAQGSCGCTVPTWPKEPIKPGETGKIDVEFDSNGKQGKQNKTVTLVANTLPNTTVIAIKGEILLPAEKK